MRRTTVPKTKVLAALLDDPTSDHYGLEIAKSAGLATGTIYPLLAQFESDGLVTSKWEAADPTQVGRPRRRYYQLTGLGRQVAEAHAGDESLSPIRGGFVPHTAGGTR